MEKQNLSDKIKTKYALTPDTIGRFKLLIKIIGKIAWLSRFPVIGPLLKRIVLFDRPEKNFTQGYSINLNVSLEDAAKNVILPVDIVKKAIAESSYRAILNKCLCRETKKCKTYSPDFGCIFIGEGSRVTAERKYARSVSIDEALNHVDRAAEMGLICQCLWIEAEQYIWGIKDTDLNRFLEICFCCPCCCLELTNFKSLSADIQSRFSGIGWQAKAGKNCSLCKICEESCPFGFITVSGGAVTVSEKCQGCGICASRCPEKAISIIPAKELKKDIKDYFWGFRPEV